MSDMNFRHKLDSEMKNTVFPDAARKKVLERAAGHGRAAASGNRLSGVKKWRESLHSLMNMELRIPVKPLVVALLITVSGIVYACVGVTRVSAEDIRKSSITVVDSNQGGQADGIYKDKG